jgi:hypothetical protein
MTRILSFFSLILVLLAACAQAENAPVNPRPDWLTLPLTNARTGETFTLADFAGKTVFVHPMATW